MVSVSVAPRDRVGVMVNYQELLERVQGWYAQRINLNPQQVNLKFKTNTFGSLMKQNKTNAEIN